MATIIKWTTPSIKVDFKHIKVATIIEAYLTIKQNCQPLIEKDLTEATIGDTYIAWKLTQEETGAMALGMAAMMCNWLLNDGTRGASEKVVVIIDKNEKDEVI